MTIRNEQPGIKEKLRQLKLANDAYARGFPFLSEDEYHKLWREIAKEDPHNPELYHTARDPNRANTVPHLFPIMGTQKAFELDDMRPFLQRFKDKQLIIEPKYDGLAAILYAGEPGRQPRLIKAGDGSYGEDISHHLPYIAVDHLDFLQYVSVELIIPWNKWDESWGKNPRNVVAGWINRNQLTRNFEGLIHAVEHENGSLCTYLDPPHDLDNINSTLLRQYSIWSAIYPIDGIMVKVASKQTRLVAGNNGTVSLWSVAWKPPMQTSWTTVEEIEWNTSRTGRIVPKIRYAPVTLCGTENSFATGNNAKWVRTRGIHPGAQILVGKAGEIIPQILDISSQQEAELPTNCPICGDWLDESGVDLVCTSLQCLGQIHKQLQHFCGTHGMDIKSVGPAMLEQLLQNHATLELLRDKPWALLEPETFGLLSDIYQVWGVATTNIYLTNLEELNGTKDVAHLISALGYHHLGYKTALKCFRLMQGQNVRTRMRKDVAANFTFAFARLRQAQSELRHFQFAPLPSEPDVTYCITGTLSEPRNDMIQYLASYNWQFVNSVTRYTNYLIVGEINKETAKQQRARELGVSIVYEHQLPQLLTKGKEQDNERRNEEVDS